MKYFAIINDKQVGPFSLEEMPAAGITPDTYVWCKDMDDWKQAREVADICRFYRNRLFDQAHPSLVEKIPVAVPAEGESWEDPYANVPLKFRRQIQKADPKDVDLESFSAKPDYSREPDTWWPFPMILSLIFFLPLGLLAISQMRKSQKAWKEGHAEDAHEFARRGKMAAGLSFSLGLILIAFFIPLFF